MKKRKKKERVIPMPTEEDKARARLKAASADPLVWAMKSVDEKFPDTRKKDIVTEEAEAAIEEPTEDILDEDDVDVESVQKGEIQAEGKTALSTNEGVVTMEVTPMRQDVSNVAPEDLEKVQNEEANKKETDESDNKTRKVHKVQAIMEKKSAEKKADDKLVKVVNNHKMQPKLIVGFAALALVAIGGVVFGVAAMVRQNQVTEELESQIAAVNGKNSENAEGEYITLKDWDLKIKIVSGLTDLTYNYQDGDYAEIAFWGAKKDSSANYTPDFAKQAKNSSPLGTVVRVPRYERAAAGRLIWYDDYYNYYYQGPSGVPNVSEDEMSWWVESYLLIKDMLTNADNYIKNNDDAISQQ